MQYQCPQPKVDTNNPATKEQVGMVCWPDQLPLWSLKHALLETPKALLILFVKDFISQLCPLESEAKVVITYMNENCGKFQIIWRYSVFEIIFGGF